MYILYGVDCTVPVYIHPFTYLHSSIGKRSHSQAPVSIFRDVCEGGREEGKKAVSAPTTTMAISTLTSRKVNSILLSSSQIVRTFQYK